MSHKTLLKSAKLFRNGRSQAVRLPKEFQFEGSEVYIEKRGSECVLSQKPFSWDDFFSDTRVISDDFMATRIDQLPQKRTSL